MKKPNFMKNPRFKKVVCTFVVLILSLGLIIPYGQYCHAREINLIVYERHCKIMYNIYVDCIYPAVENVVFSEIDINDTGGDMYDDIFGLPDGPYNITGRCPVRTSDSFSTWSYIDCSILSTYLTSNWYNYITDYEKIVDIIENNYNNMQSKNRILYEKIQKKIEQGKSYYEVMTIPKEELENIEIMINAKDGNI